ncbi:MAG: hypothetical protein JST47_13200 [Bacteroidetes bacterium]|nr:hypothetical protein [Bacteroidota bacterium]MBS1975630.1 hypothetical protein [Bacteroidota bacterium]
MREIRLFFENIADDNRIGPVHISLYMGLFYCWMNNAFEEPFYFNSTIIMKAAKISSRATYTRCIKDLHAFGYISYTSSNNPYYGGTVYLKNK